MPPAIRTRDAGLTLVEVLVVLVIIGTLTGAAALSFGARGGATDVAQQAELLAARIGRAAQDALIADRAARMEWDSDGYRFAIWDGAAWQDHPDAVLAPAYGLAGAVSLGTAGAARGTVRFDADMTPPAGRALRLRLSRGDARRVVVFDGITARVAEEET
ncbi:prepilin-type N-terminal cleavage/methylation domain-containing protein [Sulfitobacter sabulilitoris]|nr:prepilin-type N-terminal cleavage/methylation domain-containing protein [Sulfitobacter sabulilitoris]